MTRLFVLLSLGLVLVLMPGVTRAADNAEKKPADKKKKAGPTVTAGNVTYVVIKSEVTGDNRQWTLVLEATSNRGTQKILIANARAITAEGKTCNIKAPMGGPTPRRTSRRTPQEGTVDLPQGVKIQLELKMGALPKDFEGTVSRLELFGAAPKRRRGRNGGATTTTIPGQPYNATTNTMEPLVLKNVPIERLAK